jgi:hypothetical protein
MKLGCVVCALVLVFPGVAIARDRLGVWNDWGAFRDAAVPRCYAIAMAIDQPRQKRDAQPYFTVANWPRRNIRGEIHARLSREAAADRPVVITIGGQRYTGVASGFDIWAADRRGDAAIIAALRSEGDMTISARGRDGRSVRDVYHLAGAASAMDAASLGCAAS